MAEPRFESRQRGSRLHADGHHAINTPMAQLLRPHSNRHTHSQTHSHTGGPRATHSPGDTHAQRAMPAGSPHPAPAQPLRQGEGQAGERQASLTWITLPYFTTSPCTFLFSVSFCFCSICAACCTDTHRSEGWAQKLLLEGDIPQPHTCTQTHTHTVTLDSRTPWTPAPALGAAPRVLHSECRRQPEVSQHTQPREPNP